MLSVTPKNKWWKTSKQSSPGLVDWEWNSGNVPQSRCNWFSSEVNLIGLTKQHLASASCLLVFHFILLFYYNWCFLALRCRLQMFPDIQFSFLSSNDALSSIPRTMLVIFLQLPESSPGLLYSFWISNLNGGRWLIPLLLASKLY